MSFSLSLKNFQHFFERQVYRLQISSKVFISFSHLKDNFAGYRILGFFFSNVLNISHELFLSAWFLRRHQEHFFASLKVEFFSSVFFPNFCLYLWYSKAWLLYLGLGWFVCFHLSRMVFSELPGYIILCLTLIWKNCQSLLLQTLLMFLPRFLLPLLFPLHVCYTFRSCPTALGHSVVGFVLFCFVFCLFFVHFGATFCCHIVRPRDSFLSYVTTYSAHQRHSSLLL